MLPPTLLDAVGVPRTIPATGNPGSVAAMTFPGEARGFERAVPSGSAWGERDVTSDAGAVRGFARRAPRGELHPADQPAFLERIGVIGC